MSKDFYVRKNARSCRSLWFEFYELERELFAVFAPPLNKIKIIDQIEEYLPEYHEIMTKDGKKLSYPPKNIRQIAVVPIAELNQMKLHMEKMKQAYQRAVEATGETFKRMPQRFPVILRGIRSIKVFINKAHSSKKITADEDLILFKKGSSLFKKMVLDEIDRYMQETIENFAVKNIHAYVENDSLKINSIDLLKLSETSKVQLRIETGSRFRLSVYDSDQVAKIITYGWIFIEDEKTNITVSHHHQGRNLRTRQMEQHATKIELPFLPDAYQFWMKH